MPNELVTRSPPRGEGVGRILGSMSWFVRTRRVAGLLCLLGGLALLADRQARGQGTPEMVTTDTPQYCMHLLDQVSGLVRAAPAPPPEEVTSLSTEGQRMCGHGQTRGGILRLRRALVLMRAATSAP
jgi:hypothetical protein